MKYFSATRIHDGFKFLKGNPILAFDDNFHFQELLPEDEIEKSKIQHYEGTLLPGFVNAHCHLELSHTKGLVPEKTGLVDFLSTVMQGRSEIKEAEKAEKIKAAFRDLAQSGCIAVGDIANGTDTLRLREHADFHIHTFVETMGFDPNSAPARFEYSKEIFHQFEQNSTSKTAYSLRQTIVPHAPYSVSPALFKLVDSHSAGSLLSIHNQECTAENEYFKTKQGDMKRLYARLGINDDWFVASGKNSLPTYFPYLNKTHEVLIVHNTKMEASDIDFLQNLGHSVSICLCPNANLYIENELPDVLAIANSGLNICIGTDSLASNHQLNVYEEVLTLLKHFPSLNEAQILSWATSGGAKALRFDKIVGSFRNGLRPGLVHLKDKKSSRIF